MATDKVKTVYLMIKDIDGQAGVEWGVDWGLDEGEELPEDVEDMTQAQYTVWMCIQAIRSAGDQEMMDDAKVKQQDAPSGIFVPIGTSKLN
jgi:hypothetical protein